MARAFSCAAACAGCSAVPKHKRSFAGHPGLAGKKSRALLASGNGDLYVGSAAAGIKVALGRRAAGGRVRMDTGKARRTRFGALSGNIWPKLPFHAGKFLFSYGGMNQKFRTLLILGRVSNLP